MKVVNDLNSGVKMMLQMGDLSNSGKEDNMRHKKINDRLLELLIN